MRSGEAQGKKVKRFSPLRKALEGASDPKQCERFKTYRKRAIEQKKGREREEEERFAGSEEICAVKWDRTTNSENAEKSLR